MYVCKIDGVSWNSLTQSEKFLCSGCWVRDGSLVWFVISCETLVKKISKIHIRERWQGKLPSRCRRKPVICELWNKKNRTKGRDKKRERVRGGRGEERKMRETEKKNESKGKGKKSLPQDSRDVVGIISTFAWMRVVLSPPVQPFSFPDPSEFLFPWYVNSACHTATASPLAREWES